MPLDRVNRAGFENALGVHFPMKDRHTTVRVLVARRVLQDMRSSPSDSRAYMARFESFRKEFEAIASDKFDHAQSRGKIEITSSDMVRFLVERLNSN
jgi:Protein of unknown function (DUF1488)